MSRSTPSSPPLSPRQRLSSLFTGSGRAESSTLSPSAAATPTSPISSGQKGALGLTPQIDSPDALQRSRTNRLSRLTSPFKGSDVALVRSPNRRAPSMSPSNSNSPLLELPPTSSDLQDDYVDVAKPSFSPTAISRSSSYQTSRPSSPSQAPLMRSLSIQATTTVYVANPTPGPTKRAGPFAFGRSRKNSDVVLRDGAREERQAPGRHSSGPVGPTRTVSDPSVLPHRRKSIAASVIGLPTNFKHTSGIAAAPLQSAFQLAGLTAVEGRRNSASNAENAFALSAAERTSALLEDKSLAEALAQVEKALDSMPARFTNQQFQRSPSSTTRRNTNAIDTIKEVSSGFIQRLENAEQVVPITNAFRTDGGEEPILSTVGDNRATCESAVSVSTTRPSKDTLRSPPISAVRSLHRKPVPKLEDETRTEMAASIPQTEVLRSADMPSTDIAAGSVEQLPGKTITKAPSCASVKPSQDWSATLAEINAALKA